MRRRPPMFAGRDAGARAITWNGMEAIWTAAEQQLVSDLWEAAENGSAAAKHDLAILHLLKFEFEATVIQ